MIVENQATHSDTWSDPIHHATGKGEARFLTITAVFSNGCRFRHNICSHLKK